MISVDRTSMGRGGFELDLKDGELFMMWRGCRQTGQHEQRHDGYDGPGVNTLSRKETGLPEEKKCELEDDGNKNCERLG